MVVVNGRIVDFLIDRCEDGYAEFLFKSDYDKDCPRFEAIRYSLYNNQYSYLQNTDSHPVKESESLLNSSTSSYVYSSSAP